MKTLTAKGRSRNLNACWNDYDIKEAIKKDGSYWCYEFSISSRWLKACEAHSSLRVHWSSDARDCVYFVSTECTPVQSLIKV